MNASDAADCLDRAIEANEELSHLCGAIGVHAVQVDMCAGLEEQLHRDR
jgi:hypothetical protein